MVIITSDMNAKVGACNKDKERIMGTHGTGTINENGERLVEFCGMNKYVTQCQLMRLLEGDIKTDILNSTFGQYLRNILTP